MSKKKNVSLWGVEAQKQKDVRKLRQLHIKIFTHKISEEFIKYDVLLLIKVPDSLHKYSWND